MASRHDYRIGWICALSIELATAKAMLDKIHPPLPNAKNDRNKYILGSIGPHNIVMTCLPAGVYGVTSATATAIQMRYSYDAIELCFMVGIAGAAPLEFDVRLGDVVVSEPTSIYGGVIQYDRGKAMNEGRITSTGSLDKPPEALLKALCALKADHMLQGNRIQEFYSEAFERFPHLQGLISHPGTQNDHLFSSEYQHAISHPSCHQCDLSRVLTRASRPDNQPRVFYGLIASGNMLIKDAKVRDNLSQQYGILCFETEAAGLMDIFPSLVIRGICDYADSHKNKRWQGYAAAVAAAYTKELTLSLPSHEMMSMEMAVNRFDASTPQLRRQENETPTSPEVTPFSSPITTLSSLSLQDKHAEAVTTPPPTPVMLASSGSIATELDSDSIRSEDGSESPPPDHKANTKLTSDSATRSITSPKVPTDAERILETKLSLARSRSRWHPWPGDSTNLFYALKTWFSAPGSSVLVLSPGLGSRPRAKDLAVEVTSFLIQKNDTVVRDERKPEITTPVYQVLWKLSSPNDPEESWAEFTKGMAQSAMHLCPDTIELSAISPNREAWRLFRTVFTGIACVFFIFESPHYLLTRALLRALHGIVHQPGCQVKFLIVGHGYYLDDLEGLQSKRYTTVNVPPLPQANQLQSLSSKHMEWRDFTPGF